MRLRRSRKPLCSWNIMAVPSVVQLLAELIALPSVNPAFLPPGHARAGEQRVADFLASLAGELGLDLEAQPVKDNRCNLLVRLTPQGAVRQRVILAPHLDTVNAPDAGFQPRQEAGRLYGRGACDTKGSVAAMFFAMAELARSGARPKNTEIIFAGLIDEEHAQAGSRALAKSGLRADLAIVGEPTCERVVTAHKGSVWLLIRAQGRAAHGSQPQYGQNAVCDMARIVTALEAEYVPTLAKRAHPLLGNPTWSIGTICGGTQANIVPDSCEVLVDRRTLPGETDASSVQDVESFLAERGLHATVRSVKVSECLPLETDVRLPLVSALLSVAGQDKPLGAHYFCDASVLAQAGTPSVVFGPGDIAQAHTTDEWVSIEGLERAAAVLGAFLRQLP